MVEKTHCRVKEILRNTSTGTHNLTVPKGGKKRKKERKKAASYKGTGRHLRGESQHIRDHVLVYNKHVGLVVGRQFGKPLGQGHAVRTTGLGVPPQGEMHTRLRRGQLGNGRDGTRRVLGHQKHTGGVLPQIGRLRIGTGQVVLVASLEVFDDVARFRGRVGGDLAHRRLPRRGEAARAPEHQGATRQAKH